MNSIGKYWSFYWPLTILSIALLSAKLLQNFVLLTFPNGATELALFVLAFQLFKPMNAPLAMLPQVVNVLATSQQAYRSTFWFAVIASIVLSLPVFVLAWMPWGETAIRSIFELSEERISVVRSYLKLIGPIIIISGLSKCNTGILVKRRKTGVVMVLQVGNLLVLTALIGIGLDFKLSAYELIAGSWVLSEIFFLLASLYCKRKYAPSRLFPKETLNESLSWRTIWNFAWPVAVTTFMFSLSRPIVFSFITKLGETPGGPTYSVDSMVAGLGLALSFQMIFHGMVNQFRDVFVTFGKEDFSGVIRFMGVVTLLGTAAIVLVNATPLGEWYLMVAQSAEGETLEVAKQCMWVLVLMPLALMLRNYYHGISLVHRKTKGMALGGIIRNGSIVAGCMILFSFGIYNHIVAVSLLVGGFAAEGFGVQFATRKWRRELRG